MLVVAAHAHAPQHLDAVQRVVEHGRVQQLAVVVVEAVPLLGQEAHRVVEVARAADLLVLEGDGRAVRDGLPEQCELVVAPIEYAVRQIEDAVDGVRRPLHAVPAQARQDPRLHLPVAVLDLAQLHALQREAHVLLVGKVAIGHEAVDELGVAEHHCLFDDKEVDLGADGDEVGDAIQVTPEATALEGVL